MRVVHVVRSKLVSRTAVEVGGSDSYLFPAEAPWTDVQGFGLSTFKIRKLGGDLGLESEVLSTILTIGLGLLHHHRFVEDSVSATTSRKS
jgi:hypothetical protein